MIKGHWLNYIGITLALLAFWVAVSGSLHWPQLVIGLAAAIFVAYFNRNLVIAADERPPVSLRTLFWLTGYFFMLLVDIVRANFQVARLVLHPQLPVEPGLVTLPVEQDTPAGRVMLANSITLTPGTLTVLTGEREFLVHVLTEKSADSLKNWSLPARIKKMEQGGEDPGH